VLKKEDKLTESSFINIDIDFADYEAVCDHKGYTIGYSSDKMNVQDFQKEIIGKLHVHFTKAKGLLVLFTLANNNHMNLNIIQKCLKQMDDVTSDNIDMIFGTKPDHTLSSDEVIVNILLTGLDSL
jgi:cell division GTPase FtsZ